MWLVSDLRCISCLVSAIRAVRHWAVNRQKNEKAHTSMEHGRDTDEQRTGIYSRRGARIKTGDIVEQTQQEHASEQGNL